jgi:hypothetical protein
MKVNVKDICKIMRFLFINYCGYLVHPIINQPNIKFIL